MHWPIAQTSNWWNVKETCLILTNAFYICGFYGYIKGFGYFHIQGNDSNEHIKHFSFEALKSNYTVCMSICVMEHNLALWCSSMMINVNPNILTSYVFCLIREYFEISDFPSLDHNPIKSKLSHYMYIYHHDFDKIHPSNILIFAMMSSLLIYFCSTLLVYFDV